MPDSDRAKTMIAAREKGPGPGRYKLPTTVGINDHDITKHMKPEYSFGRKLDGVGGQKGSPGPAVYFIDPMITRNGKDGAPIYSILSRQKGPSPFKTPSPATYNPQGEGHQAPVYSIRARTRYRQKDQIPAPDSYHLPPVIGAQQPDKRTFPSYSMTGRSKIGSFLQDLAKTPGPGQHNAIEQDTVKKRSPMFSIQGRTIKPGDTCKKPGPGAHRAELVVANKPQPPQFSFGVRHSEFVSTFFV